MSEHICPYCKKHIYDDDALLCLYCGESLKRSIGFIGRLRYFTPPAISCVVIILILLGFLLLMIK